jgi:hypothetical protein
MRRLLASSAALLALLVALSSSPARAGTDSEAPPRPRYGFAVYPSASLLVGAPLGLSASARVNLGAMLRNIADYGVAGGPPFFRGGAFEVGAGLHGLKWGLGYVEASSGEWGGNLRLMAVRYDPRQQSETTWLLPGRCTGAEFSVGFVLVEVNVGLMRCEALEDDKKSGVRPTIGAGLGF